MALTERTENTLGAFIQDNERFLFHYRNASEDTTIFAFLLYTNRGSHKAVSNFIRESRDFLEELETRHKIPLYYFILNKTNAIKNPAAEVTRLFGVPFSCLPGILVFSRESQEKAPQAVFFPLRPYSFQDKDWVESRLVSLFEEIERMQKASQNATRTISELARFLPSLKWKSGSRYHPIRNYLYNQSACLVNLPGNLTKQFAEGYAKGLVSLWS